jgi:hypothetical protein
MMIWAGRILGGLVVVFLLFDSAVKLLQLPIAVEPTVRLGYPASLVLGVGIVELACTILYMIPPTAIAGAILLSGYLGGATATQVRVGGGFLFPVVIGAMIWADLLMREPRLRALIPIRR